MTVLNKGRAKGLDLHGPLSESLAFLLSLIVVNMAGIGTLTPPVGLCVYAVKGAIGNLATLEEVFKGSLVFLVMDYIVLLLLIWYPPISLFLPNMMGK